MAFHFCTITTASHLYKTNALIASLQAVCDVQVHVLLLDGVATDRSGVVHYSLDVLNSELTTAIKKKYKGNALRWSCKPLFMVHLLNSVCESIIYVDNDIYFTSSPAFLFDDLKSKSILLTPHHYNSTPEKEQTWFEANYRVGLYNAGFIGANKLGIPALNWWAQCCYFNIKQAAWRGLFDDQKYLDLLPIKFEGVSIIKHKGCNVAGWNIGECKRTLDSAGQVIIDGNFPLIFIHFAPLTFKNIQNGLDSLLIPYQEKYLNLLKQENPNFTPQMETKLRWYDFKSFVRFAFWKTIRFFE